MPDTERVPADRYADLPDHVREFLEDLRIEEVEAVRFVSRLSPSQRDLLVQSMSMVMSVSTVSKLVKWIIVGGIATALLASEGIRALSHLWSWFRG